MDIKELRELNEKYEILYNILNNYYKIYNLISKINLEHHKEFDFKNYDNKILQLIKEIERF